MLPKRLMTGAAAGFAILVCSLVSAPLAAQWIRHPTAGLPRLADGKVDLSAPAPRTADGKPDFSGIWTSDEVDPRRPKEPPNPHDANPSRRMINLGVDIPGDCPINRGSPLASKRPAPAIRRTIRTSGACRSRSCARMECRT